LKVQPRTGHVGSEREYFGARWWWMINAHLSCLTPRKEPLPTVQEIGWIPGPLWMGAKIPASSGLRSPNRQPVASRYTDYDISVHNTLKKFTPRFKLIYPSHIYFSLTNKCTFY